MELQKLIALYKQYKNNPKIAGWGDGWVTRERLKNQFAGQKHRELLAIKPLIH
jgi:hypothetical protein